MTEWSACRHIGCLMCQRRSWAPQRRGVSECVDAKASERSWFVGRDRELLAVAATMTTTTAHDRCYLCWWVFKTETQSCIEHSVDYGRLNETVRARYCLYQNTTTTWHSSVYRSCVPFFAASWYALFIFIYYYFLFNFFLHNKNCSLYCNALFLKLIDNKEYKNYNK